MLEIGSNIIWFYKAKSGSVMVLEPVLLIQLIRYVDII